MCTGILQELGRGGSRLSYTYYLYYIYYIYINNMYRDSTGTRPRRESTQTPSSSPSARRGRIAATLPRWSNSAPI